MFVNMDDVKSLWNHGENELGGFLDHFNPYYRNPQFTLEIEFASKLPFLDVLIIRSNDKPDFTIHKKPIQYCCIMHFR